MSEDLQVAVEGLTGAVERLAKAVEGGWEADRWLELVAAAERLLAVGRERIAGCRGADQCRAERFSAARLGIAVGFRYGWDKRVENRPDVPTDEASLKQFAAEVAERLLADEVGADAECPRPEGLIDKWGETGP